MDKYYEMFNISKDDKNRRQKVEEAFQRQKEELEKQTEGITMHMSPIEHFDANITTLLGDLETWNLQSLLSMFFCFKKSHLKVVMWP